MALVTNTSETPLIIDGVTINPRRTEEISTEALERFGSRAAGKYYLEHSLKVTGMGNDAQDADFEVVDGDNVDLDDPETEQLSDAETAELTGGEGDSDEVEKLDLSKLNKDELKVEADKLGVKYNFAIGEDTLRTRIEEHLADLEDEAEA